MIIRSQFIRAGITTYIGYCCREWVLAMGFPPGRCGYCGERPVYYREDDQ